jgi:hypothetical protein
VLEPRQQSAFLLPIAAETQFREGPPGSRQWVAIPSGRGRPRLLGSVASRGRLRSLPVAADQEIMIQRVRIAPQARMLADALEQVRSRPSVRTSSVKPLDAAKPNRSYDVIPRD